MFWIREAKEKDQSAILSLMKGAHLSEKGAWEESTLFHVVETMEEGQPEIVGAAGLTICGEFGLLRSFVLKPKAQLEKVILQLFHSLLFAAMEKNLEQVYLITPQPSTWLQALYFYQVTLEDVPEEIADSAHFQQNVGKGSIFACTLSPH